MGVGFINSGNLPAKVVANSFASAIVRYMPNGTAPLFGMTSMINSETAAQTEHGYFTKTMLFPQMTIGSGGQTAADTIFTVTSTNNIVPGMVCRVESTGENIIVNAVLSPTQVSVTRGIGGVTIAAISAAVNLYQIGTAFEESSNRPTPISIQPVRITNLTQIFRNSWGVSGTVAATQVIVGESTVAENRMDCAAFHAKDIETSLFFGQKYSGQRNGQPFRTMDGILSIISNIAYYPSSYSSPNITVAGGTTNYTQLEAALDPVFNQTTDPKSANERVLFVGGTAKKVLNNIGRLNGTYQLVDGQTSWGLQFTTFKITRGTFRVIEHPLFNTNAAWSKLAVSVDLPTFNLAYLGNRKTQKADYNSDGTANDDGIDAVGGTLTTELTTVLKNPPAYASISNLTAAAAG